MSENPLYYSGSQTSKPSNLKPALSAALASLEVKLDEELARYRRTRIVNRTPIQQSLGSLIAGKSQPQSTITFANNQNQQNLTKEQAAAYIRKQQVNSSQDKIKTPPTPTPVPETSSGMADNQGTNSEDKQVPPSREQKIPYTPASTQTQAQHASPDNQSSIVKADINQNTQNENISMPNNDNTKEPDDYLESSEALLRSLAEEQPSSTKQTNNHDSLLSPLSIGSMLLLLLSSITFGYIIFNLDNLPSLTFGGLFKRNQQTSSSENTEQLSNVQSGESKLKPIPKNPNLASDALPNINNIDDVAGATPKAKPTQAAKPQTIGKSPQSRIPTTTVEQMSPTVTADTPPAKPVSEAEVAPAPQNLDEIKPSAGGFYNVIVDNTGDTLAQVKKVVPDAYLSPEAKYVYLGAFKSKQRVKKHLEFLKESGITARVEEPDS